MQGAFTTGQYIVFAAPVLVVAVVWWLISRTDQIVNHLFPDLEWERSLGWLNIKAERKAKAGMRWIKIGIYIILFDALFGIIWGAKGLHLLNHWSDPSVIGGAALRVLALVFCLGIWVLYLGCGLMPRLRAEREEAEFKKFRAEMEEVERERGTESVSRLQSPLRKPRKNAPLAALVPDRTRRRR